ncbi:MAG TPA: metallophosphoesterase [Patescibacteria group bacterium]
MKKSQIIFFVSLIFTILLLTHIVVYKGLIFIFPISSQSLLIILKILTVVLSLSFVGSLLLSSRYSNFFTKIFYPSMATWLGFLLYLFLVSIILGLLSIFRIHVLVFDEILFGLAILIAIYGFVHEKKIYMVTTKIELPNLPEFWKDKKIIFVSDLHLGHIHGRKFAQKVADKIHGLNPDLLLIGGDLYDGVVVDKQRIIEPLKKLNPSLGIYFVTGNHDGFTTEDTDQDVLTISQSGIKVLQNEIININGLQIIGVNYRDTANRQNFTEILNGININPKQPSILLKHVPDNVDIGAEKGISLMLCGHTHRAQVWPFQFIPRLVYKHFDYGLKESGQMKVFTSSGVGTWGPPFRVGTNSEIVTIVF